MVRLSFRGLVGLGALLAASSLSTVALANPKATPFTYGYQTQPEGQFEVEQLIDSTPVRIIDQKDDGSKERVFGQRYRLQTEFEYGVTDHLELAAYLVFDQAAAASPSLQFSGVKQRLRWRLAEEGQWPVDLAFYFEVAEYHDEFELEQRLILAKRFGNLQTAINLWVEQGFERGSGEPEFVYNPTASLSYKILPQLSLGAEYWVHGKFEQEKDETGKVDFNDKPHHFLGPALSLQFGKFWWTTAAYGRLDHMQRSGEVGDQYGKIWVRTILAYGF